MNTNKRNIVLLVVSIAVFFALANRFYPYNIKSAIYMLPILMGISHVIMKKKNYRDVPKKIKIISAILSIYLVLTFNISVYFAEVKNNIAIYVLTYMGYWIMFYVYLVELIENILKYQSNNAAELNNASDMRKAFAIRLVISVGVGVGFLLVYYPGMMSPDSIVQWKQMLNLTFDDYHPVFHTLTNYLVTRVNQSPASVSLFQIILGSLIVNYGLLKLEQNGLEKKQVNILFLVYILNPANSLMMITLWKDIDYTIFLFLATIYLFLIQRSNGAWLKSNKNQLLLGFTMAFVYLYRYNGLISFVFVFLSLAVFYKKQIKQILKVFLVSILIIAFINVPLNKLLNVKHIETGGWGFFIIPLHQIGAMVSKDVQLEEKNKNILEKIMPIIKWKRNYDKNVPCSIVLNNDFDILEFRKNKINVFKLWLELTVKNPKIAYNAFIYETSVLWQINQLEGSYVYTAPREIFKNDIGLKMESKATGIKQKLDKVINFSETKPINWIFWRPGIYLFFGMLGVFIYCLKTSYKGMIIGVPLISNLMGLLVSVQAQDIRYMYIALFSAGFLFGLSFLRCKDVVN